MGFINILFTVLLLLILRTGIVGICYILGGGELASIASNTIFRVIAMEYGLGGWFLNIKTMVSVFFGESYQSLMNFLTNLVELIDFR